MEKVKVNKQFRLKLMDALKGIYLAVIVPALVTVLEVIQAGSFDLNWESIGRIAVSALAAYLLKNFFTPSNVVIENPSKTTINVAQKDPDKPILYPPGTPIHPSPTFPDPEEEPKPKP